MQINRFLIIGKEKNRKASARLTTNKPYLNSHEIAVALKLDIPDELFIRPQLEASIKVDPKNVNPVVIESEVINNIKETISKELGVDLSITVLETNKAE